MTRVGPRSARDLPKQSRTIPLKGNGDDEGKYYRCWNCGTTCNRDRDELGGSESRDGLTYTEFAPTSACAYVAGDDFVLMELGPDGEPVSAFHYYKPEAARGCPLCGSLNWDGRYP